MAEALDRPASVSLRSRDFGTGNIAIALCPAIQHLIKRNDARLGLI